MTPSTSDSAKSRSGSLLYDAKFRGTLFQVLLVAALIAFFWWIIHNTIANLRTRNIQSGFDFLDQKAGFQILTTLGTWAADVGSGVATYGDVLKVGLANTLIVALISIIGATVLGFLIGVFRLSKNVVLRGFGTVYVETLRNIPLLLQIFFWYGAVLRAPWVPQMREKASFLWGTMHFNISGLYAPYPIPQPGFSATVWAFVIGLLAAIGVRFWAKRRQEATGAQFPVFWAALLLIVGLPLAVFWMTGSPLVLEHPHFNEDGPILRRGFDKGVGMVIIPEMLALCFALTLYTASFIAEIVRAGILAVNHGQTEAAHALGLRQSQNLRLVLIPQALRVIIPPLTSQYLNVTKNSSLAMAIGYPDFFAMAQISMNQSGRAVELILIAMLTYLTFSLLTSALMNWFNARMKLVER